MATFAALVLEDPAPGAGVPLTPDGLRLVVQIAVPDPDGARYGIDVYDDGDGSDSVYSSGYAWLDLADRWRGCTWDRGKSALTEQPNQGQWLCDFANTDGYLSPRNSASTFPAVEALTTGTAMRVGYWDDVTWSPAFTGIIADIEQAAVVLDADVWATFTVVETFGVLARINRAEQSSQGGGEFAAARLDRLLADAAWSFGRDYSALITFDNAALQATTLAQNRMTEMKLTADSVFADVYTGRDGRLAVATKGTIDTLTSPNGDTYLLTDEEGPLTVLGTDYDAIPWVEAPRIHDNSDGLVNVVTAARVGGTSHTELDAESIGDNFEATYKRTDLILADDPFVEIWATQYLNLAAAATAKISDVTVDSRMAAFMPDFLRQLDNRGFCRLLRQWRRQPTIPAVRYGVRIIGYSVSIVPNTPGYPTWRATLRLDVSSFSEV